MKHRRVNNKDNETDYYDINSDNESEADDPHDDNDDRSTHGNNEDNDPGNQNPHNYNLLNEFSSRIPVWGGNIEYNGNKNVTLTNTCTIDYFLFFMVIK